ncbi:hypothetical protein E2C01_008891 [Portunus trituberculatus]|uniref:Uncharacterized protein n=1 Tax=Portunus trituberculatus TaxID=210409 RepID=A0A5B7D352_PORTR|nr:hypothetical protein [Portunus trituberculatus]
MHNHDNLFSFLPPYTHTTKRSNVLCFTSCKGRITRLTRAQTLIPLSSITLLLLPVHELPFGLAQSEAFIRVGRDYFPTHLTPKRTDPLNKTR